MRRARRLVVLLALLAGLLVSAAPTAEAAIPTIKYGDSGYNVRVWQYDINFWLAHGGTRIVYDVSHGLWIEAIAVDGIFGNQTHVVTRHFQYYYDLAVDGIVGPQTRGKMCSFLNHWAGSNKQALSLWLKTC
jgi:peptidoglycan hydrolase-like protein with peptidoglycan-binding domain